MPPQLPSLVRLLTMEDEPPPFLPSRFSLSSQLTILTKHLFCFMIKNSTVAAVMAIAVAMPMVCHAQDPATAASQIQQLISQNKAAEAIALCDRMIATYGNTRSRIAAQFAHYEPFFHWQKANIYFAAKQYEQAFEAFKVLRTDPRFQDRKLRDRALAEPNMNNGNGYEPFLTASLFYMAYSRFNQAAGDPRNNVAGDPSKFEECIQLMEEYLEMYQNGQVSDMEKAQKMDGKLCFMLMQAYLLKPQPDFQKAGEFLERSRTARAPLPDDMAMSGLDTIIRVGIEHPEHIGWIYKVIRSNPQSFSLGPIRMARYGSMFFNPALQGAKIVSGSLRRGEQDAANEGAKTTYALLGLVPEVMETCQALRTMHQQLRNYSSSVPDPAAGASYNANNCATLFKNYQKLHRANTQLEAYALVTAANVAQQYGSMRLARAGYQLLLDRYPNLSQTTPEGPKSMRDRNIFQLSQLCRATGDEEVAVALEGKINMEEMGEGGQTALLVNKMARLTSEGNWAEASAAAAEVVAALGNDKTNQNYVAARFVQVAAAYKLQKWEDVITLGEAALSENLFTAALEAGKLKEANAITNETQTRFFIIDAHSKLVRHDATHRDKIMACVEDFIKKFPNENTMQPNVVFMGINTLLERQGNGDAEAQTRDIEAALAYCVTFEEKWGGEQAHNLYPHVLLLHGNIFINGEDEARKPEGIDILERAADAALAQGDKGKSVAANAFYMLSSYGSEIKKEGENDAAMATRARSYVDRYWSEADYEGCEYSLKMVSRSLALSEGVDKASFDAAIELAQRIIAREANYGLANNSVNPDMEATINGYAASYSTGWEKYNGSALTLEQKNEHFTNFPGIVAEDKYTRAILRMAMLSSMSEAQAKLARSQEPGDKAKADEMAEQITQAFRRMTAEFRPEDLTNFICVQVGNYQVKYASRMGDVSIKEEEARNALKYFEQAVSRGGEYLDEAKLGKAQAQALIASERSNAVALFTELSNSQKQEIAGPALFGLTQLHMDMGNAAEAVACAKRFDDAGIRVGRKDMQLLYGQALAASGDVENALVSYTNLYQDMGNIRYSAPACVALMKLLWERNQPSTGDRMQGNFKGSDRWRAWNTGQVYVRRVRESGLVEKLTPDDRDRWNEVESLLSQYAADPAVQREDKENRDFQSRVRRNRN